MPFLITQGRGKRVWESPSTANPLVIRETHTDQVWERGCVRPPRVGSMAQPLCPSPIREAGTQQLSTWLSQPPEIHGGMHPSRVLAPHALLCLQQAGGVMLCVVTFSPASLITPHKLFSSQRSSSPPHLLSQPLPSPGA